MADLSRATARPWEYVPSTEHHGPYVTNEFGNTIADLYTMTLPHALSRRNGGPSEPVHFLHEMADPNAALIVKAVNLHDGLVEALKGADWFLAQCATRVAQEPGRWPEAAPEVVRIYHAVRDALAKAEGRRVEDETLP